MLVTQSIFAVLAAVLAYLTWQGSIQLWHVYLIATLFGLNNALDMPSRQAFVSELVPRRALMNAIALNSAMFNTGRILGPAIAGVVLAKWGTASAFLINGITYFGVIGGLAMMRVSAAPSIEAGSGRGSPEAGHRLCPKLAGHHAANHPRHDRRHVRHGL